MLEEERQSWLVVVNRRWLDRLSVLQRLRLDNKAAGDLAYNPEHHPKTKHIDRRHFYIRECVENLRLRVPFVKTRTTTSPTSSLSR